MKYLTCVALRAIQRRSNFTSRLVTGMTVLGLSFTSHTASAGGVEEVLVISPHAGFNGSLDELRRAWSSTTVTVGSTDRDIDLQDFYEERCEQAAEADRLECEEVALDIVVEELKACKVNLLIPSGSVQLSFDAGIAEGSISLTSTPGYQIYQACVDGVNSTKEVDLKKCEIDYKKESTNCGF